MGKKCGKWKKYLKWISHKLSVFVDFTCSFLEIHLVKIVAFSVMCLCCLMLYHSDSYYKFVSSNNIVEPRLTSISVYVLFEVNALHMIIVVMLLMCLLFGTSALQFSFSFIGPYLSILFMAKMTYQTEFFPNFKRDVNCSIVNATFPSIIANTILDSNWWGFEHLDREDLLLSYYKSYVLVFLVMTLQTVIRTRQKITRIDSGLPADVPPVMFLKITRKDADKSLKHCLKFLINYGFYKFGIEITLTYCVFVIGFREDAFSILYSVWVFILILPKRTTLSILWPFFLTTVLFSVLWQYTMAVGLSDKTCFTYAWSEQDSLIKWLFLPNFKLRPNTIKTLNDFVLLLLIQRQQTVFEVEKRVGDRHNGGSNKEEYLNYRHRDFVNPYPDHTLGVKSWIDLAKLIFMSWFFRITLAFLFWNGASNVNVLSLGYLVGAFIFLWIDFDLCLWNIEKILKWWNTLLIFTALVILLKAILEFVGCVYGESVQIHLSFIVGLFWDKCCTLISEEQSHSFDWDVVCFFCVIIQRRYFKSRYFLHEMDDVSGIFRLQAKGAQLMDELQELRLKEFQERERRTLLKIKKNMNRIKAWQKRMQGLNYNEPTDHETAIYMGDYFMFEDLEKVSRLSSSSSDENDVDRKKRGNVTEFIETVFKRQLEEIETKAAAPSSSRKAPEEKKHPDRKSEDLQKRKKKARRGDTFADSSPKPSDYTLKKRKSEDKSEDSEDMDEEDDEDKQKKGRFRSFMVEVLVFLIHFFNKYSEDYRYIQYVVEKERKKRKARSSDESEVSDSRLKFDHEKLQHIGDYEEDDEDYYKKPLQKLIVNALNAFTKFCMSKTELLCYLSVFFHTILSPNVMSLALPIMVFLWGSLTSIRPTSTFWTVLIAYTEVMVVIKALFQNSIFPWNSTQKKASHVDYPPLYLGIHKDNQYVLADLFLLLMLFIHRYKLKTLGLWNRTHEGETFPPEDLKVYTELSSERDLKEVKGNRSLVYQRKLLLTDTVDSSASITMFMQTALWKCTSRATAKMVFRGEKMRTQILVKEIEGEILVTHDGRRLQPTRIHVSQMAEEDLEGNVVLRVYTNEIVMESKSLQYKLTWVQHITSIRKFFLQILVRDWRMSSDFYTFMFMFQFTNFLIIFFGYSSFSNPDDIQSDDYFSLTENQVPPMYLFTIIAHFAVIIIDRILYLRKCVVGKLILQFILVILIHVWMFILIPIVTEGFFNRLIIRQIYYLISCLYFLMSAYQLRVGYPLRVQGHFLSRRYGYVNYYAYKGLQFLPFFNQLRTLLDYLCIHTSLSMGQWIKMESIFQVVFENKCSRRADIYYPSARGEECPKVSKYCPGVLSFSALVIIIWFPFIIFALFNTVAQPNLPQEASLEMHIGNFGKLFTSVASFNDIITFTQGQYKTLQKIYKDSKKLWTFLTLYDHRDIGVLKFRFEPFQPWSITPKELSLLNETVQNLDLPVTIYLILEVQRIPRSQIVAVARGYSETVLRKGDESRQQLADAFLKKGNAVRLNHVLPKFVHITNEGKAKAVSGFMTPATVAHRNVTFTLIEDNDVLWWKLVELADDPNEGKINQIPYEGSQEVTIFTFNEKNTPKLLLNVRKKGIIGLYLSIVLVTWTFARRIMLKYPKLLHEEMPNPDPVLQLCKDIYLARESHEFALEEDLYAKLLFLFRSPETMIKVTRLTNIEARVERP